ncbi:PilZ domain-containing protein [Paucibacter sp. M5-1]|uniref:PilZ domain-containing protein n=1 Tax=Paucibacter sp. M5-1 TaxID=3015998 RepID=UPI003F81D562
MNCTLRQLREPIITTERRHFARVAFDTDAQLTTTTERLDIKVQDLSLKGALLRLPRSGAVAVGDPCLLNISLAQMEVGIAMAGEVAHVEGEHVGLLCRSIDIESITHLRRLLEINLGDAALLERELKALISS